MRGRSVLLWVVVPFGVLCALGLWLTRPAPRLPAPPPPPPERPPSLVTPPVPGASAPVMSPPAFPSSRGTPALLPVGPPPPPTGRSPAEEDEALVQAVSVDPVVREDVRTALRAVRPLLDECFADFAERHPGEQRATVRFTLGRQDEEGRLGEGQVVDTTVQHPMLQACLEDSLLDARFPAPRRGEGLVLTWPYRSRPPTPSGAPASPAAGAPPTGR